jgi:hypothetical protein
MLCEPPYFCEHDGVPTVPGMGLQCDPSTTTETHCGMPMLRFGSTTGGFPHKHGWNSAEIWCAQLGGSGGSFAYGHRSGNKLFWAINGGWDLSGTPHWADWQDGHWRDESLDHFRSSANFITSFSCANPGSIGNARGLRRRLLPETAVSHAEYTGQPVAELALLN